MNVLGRILWVNLNSFIVMIRVLNLAMVKVKEVEGHFMRKKGNLKDF